MLDASFWIAVDRILAAEAADEDIEAIAEQFLKADRSLGDQLQEALTRLDVTSLAEAVTLSDGMGATEDAMIAVGCAVLAGGPDIYLKCVREPGSLVQEWDLSQGDLLLVLNPGVTLLDGEESDPGDERQSINLSFGGDSRLGWHGWITDAIAFQRCRRAEKSQRWQSIFAKCDANLVIIHVDALPGNAHKVGEPSGRNIRCLEVEVTWDSPRSPFRLTSFVDDILDAVATRLERT